eukprot:1485523-Ditylum_brightwellii.AAC.1
MPWHCIKVTRARILPPNHDHAQAAHLLWTGGDLLPKNSSATATPLPGMAPDPRPHMCPHL